MGEEPLDPIPVGGVGIELEVLAILDSRFGIPALKDVDHAQAAVGGGERRIERDRGLEGGERGSGVEGPQRFVALGGFGGGGGAVGGAAGAVEAACIVSADRRRPPRSGPGSLAVRRRRGRGRRLGCGGRAGGGGAESFCSRPEIRPPRRARFSTRDSSTSRSSCRSLRSAS